ncbi:SNF1-interacting protein, partial [Coniosporium uncinatum]
SDTNINNLTVPITSRSPSFAPEANLSPSHPAFSYPGPPSPFGSPPSSTPFFRGRAKTLASLATGSKNNSQSDMAPQEVQLPKDPYVNGQRVEAFLYKDASECPICFMYYPPYLNKTRCCDQPICSECFVQIKRPDPHPPEHHDADGNPVPISQPNPDDPQSSLDQATQLVSEPAACPFCVQPEFGVTYESPPFRRGLTYAHQGHQVASAMSAMSSSSSLASQGIPNGNRRRTVSLSANSPQVITTDRVRPDWAKKLSDARAHAMRRAAAATALHNAAYVLGQQGGEGGRGFGLGRRRRTMMFGDSPGSASGNGTPRIPDQMSMGNVSAMLAAAERQSGQGSGRGADTGTGELYPPRRGSRGRRLEDLEELMFMEAVRLSLAAEDERKRKEDKEQEKIAKKEGKKQEKQKKKEEKKAKKEQSKYGAGFHPLHPEGMDTSSSFTP